MVALKLKILWLFLTLLQVGCATESEGGDLEVDVKKLDLEKKANIPSSEKLTINDASDLSNHKENKSYNKKQYYDSTSRQNKSLNENINNDGLSLDLVQLDHDFSKLRSEIIPTKRNLEFSLNHNSKSNPHTNPLLGTVHNISNFSITTEENQKYEKTKEKKNFHWDIDHKNIFPVESDDSIFNNEYQSNQKHENWETSDKNYNASVIDNPVMKDLKTLNNSEGRYLKLKELKTGSSKLDIKEIINGKNDGDVLDLLFNKKKLMFNSNTEQNEEKIGATKYSKDTHKMFNESVEDYAEGSGIGFNDSYILSESAVNNGGNENASNSEEMWDINSQEIFNTTVEDIFSNTNSDFNYSAPVSNSMIPKNDIIERWLAAEKNEHILQNNKFNNISLIREPLPFHINFDEAYTNNDFNNQTVDHTEETYNRLETKVTNEPTFPLSKQSNNGQQNVLQDFGNRSFSIVDENFDNQSLSTHEDFLNISASTFNEDFLNKSLLIDDEDFENQSLAITNEDDDNKSLSNDDEDFHNISLSIDDKDFVKKSLSTDDEDFDNRSLSSDDNFSNKSLSTNDEHFDSRPSSNDDDDLDNRSFSPDDEDYNRSLSIEDDSGNRSLSTDDEDFGNRSVPAAGEAFSGNTSLATDDNFGNRSLSIDHEDLGNKSLSITTHKVFLDENQGNKSTNQYVTTPTTLSGTNSTKPRENLKIGIVHHYDNTSKLTTPVELDSEGISELNSIKKKSYNKNNNATSSAVNLQEQSIPGALGTHLIEGESVESQISKPTVTVLSQQTEKSHFNKSNIASNSTTVMFSNANLDDFNLKTQPSVNKSMVYRNESSVSTTQQTFSSENDQIKEDISKTNDPDSNLAESSILSETETSSLANEKNFNITTESRMALLEHRETNTNFRNPSVSHKASSEYTSDLSYFYGTVCTNDGNVCVSLNLTIKIFIHNVRLHLPVNVSVEENSEILQNTNIPLRWETADNLYNISTLFQVHYENGFYSINGVHLTITNPTNAGKHLKAYQNDLELFKTEIGTTYQSNTETVLSMQHGIMVHIADVQFLVRQSFNFPDEKHGKSTNLLADYYLELIGASAAIVLLGGVLLYTLKKMKGRQSFKPTTGSFY